MDHTWQAHRHLKKKNVIKWQLQGASSTKASIFRGARSIEERRRVETDFENQRGGRRRGGLGRRRWSDRQCKCRFHLLTMILCCSNWKDKKRQDKMICNEKMKVAHPPPRLIWRGVQLPVACLCHCILSPPLHLTNIRASSFLLDQSDTSQNLCGKGVHNLLTWSDFRRFFFNQTEILNSLRLEL